MTSAELGVKLKEVQEEQFKLKLQQVSGQLEHPSRIKDMRRNVARIKTFQQQRNAED
jgi:large subunit ribosomal protein L29